MNLRDAFVSIGCFAAALGLQSAKPAQADDLRTRNEAGPQSNERCAVSITPVGEAIRCERIGGHLRVEFGPLGSGMSGMGRPVASPAAVRLDNGAASPGHLRLPGVEPGLDPIRR